MQETRNTKLIVKNSILLFIRQFLVLILSFFITRVTLQMLGEEDYGINDIVSGIIVIFAIITMPLSSTLQRFFNVEFAKKDICSNKVFNTAFIIVIMVTIVMILLYETIGLFIIKNIVNIPYERKAVVGIIYQIVVVTNILMFLIIPFQSFLISRESMSFIAIMDICLSLYRLAMLFIIPIIKIDRLISYSIIMLSGYLLLELCYVIYCNHQYPETHLSKIIDKSLFKRILSFSGWNLIESTAGIGITYGSNFIINIFGGVLFNTVYGLTKQLSSAILTFTTNIIKAVEPQITSANTLHDNLYRDKLVITTIKYTLLLTGYIYVIMYYDGDLLLNVWLKKVPNMLYEFINVSMITMVFSCVVLPLRTLILATGSIKGYFVGYGLFSSCSLIVSYYLLYFKYPIITIMYVLCIFQFIILLWALYIVKKHTDFLITPLLKQVSLVLAVIILTFIIYGICHQFFINSYSKFAFALFVSLIFISVITIFLLLTRYQRTKILKIIKYIYE